jgi:hypothetical protein
MAADALTMLRARIAGGSPALGEELQRAVVARVEELIEAVEAGDRAAARVPKPALAEAAARLAHVRYLTGRGWRRYLAGNPEAEVVAAAIAHAVDVDTRQLASDIERAAANGATAPVIRHSPESFAIPCAVCGGEAVTLTLSKVSPAGAEQLVVSSVSPVTVFRSMAGPRMHDVLALVAAGDAAKLVAHLRATQPGGCDAYCERCNRVYCKQHYAIEAQWSGSWHEGTFATCPLGHEHTID